MPEGALHWVTCSQREAAQAVGCYGGSFLPESRVEVLHLSGEKRAGTT